MVKPVVLWADLTINGSAGELRQQFSRHCQLLVASELDRGTATMTGGGPKFLCFEYDFPDRRGLAILRDTKDKNPSVPIIMITLAHSEALAVWAFRAGAWDYASKPMSDADVERICRRMQSLLETLGGNSRRTPATAECDPPVETQYVARARRAQSCLPAMSYLESHCGEKISEKQVAAKCGMSTFRFSRAFHQQYGVTFRDALLQLRVRQAKRLLGNLQLSITQVAFMAGFGDASHFGKMFRRVCNQTATEYRAEIADGLVKTQSATDSRSSVGDGPLPADRQIGLHLPRPY